MATHQAEYPNQRSGAVSDDYLRFWLQLFAPHRVNCITPDLASIAATRYTIRAFPHGDTGGHSTVDLTGDSPCASPYERIGYGYFWHQTKTLALAIFNCTAVCVQSYAINGIVKTPL